MKIAVIDGSKYISIIEVHDYLRKALDFGIYYGKNTDALLDRLTTDVERPFIIEWQHMRISKERFGDDVRKMVDIFKAVEKSDNSKGWEEKFEFIGYD